MTRLRILATCAVALASSLLLARVHPFGDAGLYAATPEPAHIMQHANVPPGVRDLLIAKCADCHSTQTRAPFYGRLAPISWLMERDILEGRKHMNLSHWDQLTPDEREALMAAIVQQTRTRSMPLPQYRLIHWNARITDADVKVLQAWARGPSPSETAGSPTSSSPGDASQGKLVFEKRCVGCHAVEQNREGPRLAGVYGRTAASTPQFSYSTALKKARITWNDDSLEHWLADPDTFVPGNDMEFAVRKPDERRNLIAYLKQLPAQ